MAEAACRSPDVCSSEPAPCHAAGDVTQELALDARRVTGWAESTRNRPRIGRIHDAADDDRLPGCNHRSMLKRGRALLGRAGWSFTDQALSSLSNFGLSVLM